jgi:Family of unknown function (DUF5681)
MSHGKVGYKRPPVKNRYRKGQSGNPQGGWKGQRNLPAVLAEVLNETVVVKQGNKSERMSKGEALIKMLMSMAHQGDRRAINAMINLTEKIEGLIIRSWSPALISMALCWYLAC